jgi:hypothetical protein
MASDQTLDKVYARSMMQHPYGYALYHPTTTAEIYPGAIGFFDSLGVWRRLAKLEDDEKTLAAHGLSPPKEELDHSAPDCIAGWEPKFSESVTAQEIGAEGEVE